MKKIKRLGVFSFGKLLALIGGLLGLICGIWYAVGGLLIDIGVSMGWLSPEAMGTPGLSHGTVLAFGALIGMPLIGVCTGFVVGLIGALLYNLYASWFGGVQIDIRN